MDIVLGGHNFNAWGVLVLIVGAIGLLVGRLLVQRGSRRVIAKKNSIAVGGDSNAPITMINAAADGASGITGMDVWNIICGITSFIGLYLTIYGVPK